MNKGMSFSDFLTQYKDDPEADRYFFSYDPNDPTNYGMNYLYATSLDQAKELASTICKVFGFGKHSVSLDLKMKMKKIFS